MAAKPRNPWLLVYGWAGIFGIGGLVGCNASSPTMPNMSLQPDQPSVSPSPTALPPSGSPVASPQPTPSSVMREAFRCNTPSYYADVTWQQDQPRLSFTRKPNDTTLNQATPVSLTHNDDGSITYGYQRDTIVYSRVYADQSCFVQVVNPMNSNVVIEEVGTVAPLAPLASNGSDVDP
ncbi:hypothetical protein ACQ4M4_03620 [Leptolyngbya sp. AN02str]|uniref:hypothetical protein n=1 Tax=Leptolyngbya sp. AN02str TaxID=3423363 RepID=UPI003D31E6ED